MPGFPQQPSQNRDLSKTVEKKFLEPSPTPELAFAQLPSLLELASLKTTWGVVEFYYLKSHPSLSTFTYISKQKDRNT